jgi:iron(III) transport system ATP-binding protein
LLLDEPLSNLDAKLRVSLRKQIREIQKNLSITAIYVTHDQEEALEISDQIALLNAGDLQQVGTPSQVYENPKNLFVADFLGEGNFIKGKIDGEGKFSAYNLPLHFNVDPKEDLKGKDVTLMVRPEMVTVTDSEKDGYIEGRIVGRFYLGSLKKYIFDIGNGKKITMMTFKDIGSVGSTMHLKFEDYRFIRE